MPLYPKCPCGYYRYIYVYDTGAYWGGNHGDWVIPAMPERKRFFFCWCLPLRGFVRVILVHISCPFAKQNQAEVWPRFQNLLKLLLSTKGLEWVKLLGSVVPLHFFCKFLRQHYLKNISTQGAADAWEHRGRARLPQKGDVAQDGGGCWRCFTYEVGDDDIYIMMQFCLSVCNEKWSLPPGSLL